MWPMTSLPRSRTTRALALVLLALLLSTVVWWPMIAAAPRTADLDGRYFLQQWEAGKAALRQGEWPLWNPFDCRGVPMWDHPESMTGSPLLVLLAWVPGTITLWIWNIVHCAGGFLSMWLLARREVGLSRGASFVAASAWAFSVSHISQYAGAHSSLSDFWLAPLLVYLWRRAEHHVDAAVKLGLVIAFMVYEGATYPLPFVIAVVVLETLTRVWPPRRVLRILAAGGLTAVTAIGASAARLLPLADQLMSKKRQLMLPDVDMLGHFLTLRQMFLWREGRWWAHLPHQQYVWGEYIAYVGPVLGSLAVIGLFIALRERRWLVAVAAFTFLLMLGHWARWAPWDFLNRNVLPYKSMRVPSRFRLILQMFIALWVGLAIDRVPRMLPRSIRRRAQLVRAARVALIVVGIVGVVDAVELGMTIIRRMHQGPPERSVARSPRFYYGGPGLAEWLDQPRQNRAFLGCRSYEWPANYGAPVWSGDVPQARPKPDAEGLTVTNVVRTQNTFTFDVEAREPGRVLVNSAHAPGWRSSVGTVGEEHTLLVLDVPAGTHHVRMRYWPRMLTPGLVITGLTFVGIFVGWGVLRLRLRRARRARTAAASAAPSD